MSAADRFITAAVAPLADNVELEHAARQHLGAAIEHVRLPVGDSLEVAAERLERSGPRDPGRPWRLALYLVVGIASVLAWAGSAKFVSVLVRSQSLEAGELTWTGIDPLYEDFRSSLTPRQELLLFGDLSKNTFSEPAKALWDSDMDNPAYFAEFLKIHQLEFRRPPADFLPVARRLAPQNSFFTLLAANDSAKEAGSGANSAALEEAISLFHQAAAQADFNDYEAELRRQRIALLPPPRETMEWLLPCLNNYQDVAFIALIEALALNATQLAEEGDAARMENLVAAWEAVCGKILARNQRDLGNGERFRDIVAGPLPEFISASEKLGLTREAARLKGIQNRMENWHTALADDWEEPYEFPASVYADIVLSNERFAISRLSPRTPAIRAEDLRPGVAAEHAQLARALALGSWLVLAPLAMGAALFRFRGGALSRRLAPRLARLLRPGDFAWLLGAVLLPLAFHLAISRLTRFGHHSLQATDATAYAISLQSLALLLLLLAMPLLVARWRLTRRAGAVGMASRSRLLGLAVLAGFLAIPLLGVGEFNLEPIAGSAILPGPLVPSIAALILIGLLALALFAAAIAAAASRHRRILRRLVLARTLVPAYAVATLAMALLALTFHAEEKFWVSRDFLMAIPPDSPFLTRFDQRAAQDLHQDLVEIWGSPD
jgi:hypothetical protein